MSLPIIDSHCHKVVIVANLEPRAARFDVASHDRGLVARRWLPVLAALLEAPYWSD
jgi:hypothetical protein